MPRQQRRGRTRRRRARTRASTRASTRARTRASTRASTRATSTCASTRTARGAARKVHGGAPEALHLSGALAEPLQLSGAPLRVSWVVAELLGEVLLGSDAGAPHKPRDGGALARCHSFRQLLDT
jgi:hypothetical protein